MDNQVKALKTAIVLGVILTAGIIFLGWEFSKMNTAGVQCLQSPLGYAEHRMQESKGKPYDCSCEVLTPGVLYNFSVLK